MIAPNIVAEVRRLLTESKFSHRQVARLTGVSRNTVGAIAAGRHRNDNLPKEPCDDDSEKPAGPPRRCPGCGGLVYMPCLLCRAKEKRLPRAMRMAATIFVGSPALDLRPEHRARYEEVRRARQAMERKQQDNVGQVANLPC